MRRRDNTPILVAVLTSCGLAVLFVGMLVLNSVQTPAEPQRTAQPKRRPQAVVKASESPDQPLKALPDHSRVERVSALNRELKDVRQAIDTTKERISVLRRLAIVRGEPGNPAIIKGSREEYRAIANQQQNERDAAEIQSLNARLATLLDRETELELAIAKEGG